MCAQKAAFQLARAAYGAAGAANDLAWHDLAAAQRNALAGVAVTDGVSQPGKDAVFCIHKGHGTDPRRRIPHPHPGTPLPGGFIPHRGENGLPLFVVPDIDQLQRLAFGRFQRFVDGIVRFGCRRPQPDHPVAQPQASLLGRIHGAVCGYDVRKAHHKRPF